MCFVCVVGRCVGRVQTREQSDGVNKIYMLGQMFWMALALWTIMCVMWGDIIDRG